MKARQQRLTNEELGLMWALMDRARDNGQLAVWLTDENGDATTGFEPEAMRVEQEEHAVAILIGTEAA